MTAFVIDWIIDARRCAFGVRSLAQVVIFCLLVAPMLTAAFGTHAQDAISLGRTASQHSLGVGVGRLAHRTVNAG